MSVVDKNTRAFVTPEGVDLRLQIGDGGQRAAAFFIDTAMSVSDVDDETLSEVARDVEQLTFRLGRTREPGAGFSPRSHGDYLPRSPIVGEASPLAPRLGGKRCRRPLKTLDFSTALYRRDTRAARWCKRPPVPSIGQIPRDIVGSE